jgi:uncharacterized protein
VFKALQTYSSGEIVRWIQLATPQDPNPDTPAPVLTLTSGTSGSSTAQAAGGHPAAGSSTITADTLAIIALVLSAGSLFGVAVLVARGRRRNDSLVESHDHA